MRLLSLLLLLALSLSCAAQPLGCGIGDDGFNVGCCSPVFNVNLPQFPNIQIRGKNACIRACAVEDEGLVNITLSPPSFVTCDIALIQATVMPLTPNAPAYSGLIIAKYARTWREPSPFGLPDTQVWRFIVNGDLLMTPTPVAPMTPCPYPDEVLSNSPIHFWGSIDYACEVDPLTGVNNWMPRLDLTHAPGCLQHAPWSARPLPAAMRHDERSYHLIAPANFVFAPTTVPMGPIVAESVRSSRFNAAGLYECLGEVKVLNGMINNVAQNCLCTPFATTGRWTHQDLFALADCAGVTLPVSSIPLPGTIIPTGLVTMSLGSWVPVAGAPMTFPTPRDLHIYFGVLDAPDHCGLPIPVNVVHGVATVSHQGILFGNATPGTPPIISNGFLDLANNLSLGSATFGFPVWGEPSWSDKVFNFNLP